MSIEDDLRFAVRRSLREARISQAEASRRLGVSTKHMSHMLTGKATMSLNWADKILELCGKRLTIGVAKMHLDG